MSGGAPPKKQRRNYSGKKKRHTQKAQVIADQKTKQILASAFSVGRRHDFNLFVRSRTALSPKTRCLADSGYVGLCKHHANSQIPHKKSKRHPLTGEQKAQNWQLARERFVVEHIIRSLKSLKVFRILSQTYRNRRKRFALRFNLIAAIYNKELVD